MLVNKKMLVSSLLVSVFAMATVGVAQAAGDLPHQVESKAKAEQIMPKHGLNPEAKKPMAMERKHISAAKQEKGVKHHLIAKKAGKQEHLKKGAHVEPKVAA
ncbi:hypothetical protein QV08_07345 [Gallibacterium salpingitidis]|uniref:Acid-shock protein n=1 Tax=Gallibacterium salpingitidis TaxID=505341 RepID=A0AB36E4H7_9PAST|nr:hypothetical protein [Gallibacterium salpingitidis]OBX07447.1 hypothetical protein QV08_07345 [Gallibacterium salpingitidis]OBX10844.1 hypothetical protein QV09_04440 [Gallibacterium salpingitidis]